MLRDLRKRLEHGVLDDPTRASRPHRWLVNAVGHREEDVVQVRREVLDEDLSSVEVGAAERLAHGVVHHYVDAVGASGVGANVLPEGVWLGPYVRQADPSRPLRRDLFLVNCDINGPVAVLARKPCVC